MDPIEHQKLAVAVVAGGISDEREVSLKSGNGVVSALSEADVRAEFLDLAEPRTLARLSNEEFDVAFLALHGGLGENGAVQGYLQVLGLPYTGSGIWSAATAMDKWKSKCVYREAGLLTPPGLQLSSIDEGDVDAVGEEVGFPCMLKPIDGGSSVGLYKLENREQLRALSETGVSGSNWLIEKYIDGDVFTVGVIGNRELHALPPLWLDFDGECDYDAKNGDSGRLRHVVPAPNLSSQESERLQSLARRAHASLDCRGASRTDFIRDEEGKFWILETNTLPGMTKTSSLPAAAMADGISYKDLCLRLISLALEQD